MNSRADPHPKKVIPYKEYAARREAERRVLTTSKSTSGEEENWDKETPLPPCETPPVAKSMVPSQENEWKLMVNQDSHSGSVAGDSGHRTMAATGEDEPIDSTEELIGAVGGVDESVTSEHLSDVEWRDDDPLFMFNDENVTKLQILAAALTPVQSWEEDKAVSSLESPLGKKPCFRESIVECLSKTAFPTCLKPNYSNAELFRYMQPSLVNVIPWIKYEAQNMLEPSFRQKPQCIKEVEHLRYIITMIVCFHPWRQDQGWWPLFPTCNFQVGALATVNIETRVMSIVSQINMTLGERQVLWVLTTLQCLAEIGPKSPPPRHVAHSMQSIMRPLEQTEISFMPHAVLGYSTSV